MLKPSKRFWKVCSSCLLLLGILTFKNCNLSSETVLSYPIYYCTAGNPNDYRLFANGAGWDGFWYVGYNRAWVEKVFIPENMSNYKRIFVGAKLGRMKSRPVYRNGKATLDKEAIPGDIYIAMSSTPAWKKAGWKLLTNTSAIPFEGDSELAIEQVGESQWFWAEVPAGEIRFGAENYIALWSTSPYLTDSTNSPILAAAWGGKDADSYITDEVKGAAPQYFSTNTFKSVITVFEPAIAVKLVPENPQNIGIGLMGVADGENISEKKVIYASVLGSEIEKVWLEISKDNKKWEKYGLINYTAPYIFSLDPKKITLDEPSKKKSKGKTPAEIYFRVVAADIWENSAVSSPVKVFIVDKDGKK